jgi:peroxiredoxin
VTRQCIAYEKSGKIAEEGSPKGMFIMPAQATAGDFADGAFLARRKRQLFAWVVCLLSILCALPGCGKKAPPAVGDVPPKITLGDLKGVGHTVPDDYAGKVIVIRFWVDSCKSCEKEMPEINALYNKYKDRGLVVLAVNVGQSRSAASAFITRLKISFPALLDTDSSAAERYGARAVPFTVVIDRTGIVRKRILGETDIETFEKIIRSLL